MYIDVKEVERRMNGAITTFKHDLASLRVGRAATNMLDSVVVESYGLTGGLNTVGQVSVANTNTLLVTLYDPSQTKLVYRAISDANLGLNAQVDGANVRVTLPVVSTERRKEMVKLSKEFAEKGKVAVRNVRRDTLNEIKRSDMLPHVVGSLGKKIQEATDNAVEEITKLQIVKEKELTSS